VSNYLKTGYILGLSRGHNAGVCLLKDGKIVFAIEEERLSRTKYDGGPYAAMMLVKQYTDKVDYIVISHTQSLESTCGKVDYTGDNIYVGLARKLKLIEHKNVNLHQHPQVIDLSKHHHKIHAAAAFYRSGFEEAVAVIVDGAGTSIEAVHRNEPVILWEVESIFDCNYKNGLKTVYKHYGCRSPVPVYYKPDESSKQLDEEGTHAVLMTGHAGITKVYEAVTEYCGFQSIEAGKTMGLFPYGKPNNKIPKLFQTDGRFPLSNADLIIPLYPNGALVNQALYEELNTEFQVDDVTQLQNRRDLAYACQTETQDQVLNVILSAVALTGKKKVVLSGGYALNCVANYHYLTELSKQDIELYVEPVSNDGGTAIGVALLFYHMTEVNAYKTKHEREIYLGPRYNYTTEQINQIAEQFEATITLASNETVVELMQAKNIVAIFQGRSENGPRALGNRSLMFDPTFVDGKDFVNEIKRREYFRPFAGSILEEDAHEWFDLRGMPNSPHMMYAVNCQPGIEEKIPSIIHVDGTCRIQTVKHEENPHYYDVIKTFKDKTGIPIIFNTSFNLGGEPLVETLEDAIWTLKQSQIEYLYLPEYKILITVKNQ